MAARGRDPDTQLASPCKQGAHSQVSVKIAILASPQNVDGILFRIFSNHSQSSNHLQIAHRLSMRGLVTLRS